MKLFDGIGNSSFYSFVLASAACKVMIVLIRRGKNNISICIDFNATRIVLPRIIYQCAVQEAFYCHIIERPVAIDIAIYSCKNAYLACPHATIDCRFVFRYKIGVIHGLAALRKFGSDSV